MQLTLSELRSIMNGATLFMNWTGFSFGFELHELEPNHTGLYEVRYEVDEGWDGTPHQYRGIFNSLEELSREWGCLFGGLIVSEHRGELCITAPQGA